MEVFAGAAAGGLTAPSQRATARAGDLRRPGRARALPPFSMLIFIPGRRLVRGRLPALQLGGPLAELATELAAQRTLAMAAPLFVLRGGSLLHFSRTSFDAGSGEVPDGATKERIQLK